VNVKMSGKDLCRLLVRILLRVSPFLY